MDSVQLDDAEKARIFEQRIKRDFILSEGRRPLPGRPELIVLGGQPGAGKTGVLSTSQQELEAKGATWTINADDFAAYHPSYKQLQRTHGAAADMVRGVTSDWIKRTVAVRSSGASMWCLSPPCANRRS